MSVLSYFSDEERLWAHYFDHPEAWVRDLMKVEPEPWQEKVLRDLAEKDRVSVRSGHGVGKSALDAWTILWFMSTRFPTKVPCTAPTSHQLQDILWSELAVWLRRLPTELHQMFELKDSRLELKSAPEESFAVARTSRPEAPEALQGFHSQNLLFVLDEASGIPDPVFEVAQGALSTPGAKVLMTANPTRTSGYFFDSHHKNRQRWSTHRVSCFDSSQVGEHYPDEVAAIHGLDSNVYRVRVLGEFPRSEDDVIIPLWVTEAAIDRDVIQIPGYKPVWGLDIAEYGDDRCALAKRNANVLTEPIKFWHGNDLMETVGRVMEEYLSAKADGEEPGEIVIDSIGIGAGVASRLSELGLPVVRCNVGETARRPGYSRLRTELWFMAREWFFQLDVKMPSDDPLIAELTQLKYRTLSTGKVEAEPKDKFKTRVGRSPDLADAFIMTFAGGLVQVEDEMMDRYQKRMRAGKKRNWRTL